MTTQDLTAFKKLAEDSPGKIYYDQFEDGVRALILRGPACLCAYLGVPKDHPLAGFSSDDLNIPCNGGLTYSGEGGKEWPQGFYWYGWDYAHCGDLCFYDLKYGREKGYKSEDKPWLVEDVKKELRDSVYYFKKLMALAERVAKKQVQ
jgi:hypothetical protein